MKKLIFLAVLSTLLLSACGGVDSSKAAATPEEAWESLKVAATEKNCDNFKKHVTERQQMSENDCAKAFQAYEQEMPELDWEATKYNEEKTEAKVYLTNGRSLTTFVKQEDGGWKADTKFWR